MKTTKDTKTKENQDSCENFKKHKENIDQNMTKDSASGIKTWCYDKADDGPGKNCAKSG